MQARVPEKKYWAFRHIKFVFDVPSSARQVNGAPGDNQCTTADGSLRAYWGVDLLPTGLKYIPANHLQNKYFVSRVK